MTPQQLGAKWSAARATKGLTRRGVCEMLGMLFMPSDLRAVEDGDRVPTLSMLIACSQLYGVPESELLG